MLEAAWSIVAASFILVGIFGYASRKSHRPFMMFAAAVISAFILNAVASQLFKAVEIRTYRELGTIQEDQIQPDMPNLVSGIITFGWAFFFAGYAVGLFFKPDPPNRKNKQGVPPNV